MNSRRIRYIEILNTSLREYLKDKEELIKVKEKFNKELIYIVGPDINSKINIIDNKINDINKELSTLKQSSISNLKELLYTKEKELIYLDMITSSLLMCNNVSSYQYINGLLDYCGSNINDLKAKIQLDVDVIKEDINRLIILEALNVKVYDIDSVYVSYKNPETNSYMEFKTKDGYFFVCIDDMNVLVLVIDEENVDKLEIEYDKKIEYEGKSIYVGIKHNIPKEKLPY